MVKTPSAAMAPKQLRAARRELLDTGRLSGEGLDEGLSRSWLRSRDFGLSPVGRPPWRAACVRRAVAPRAGATARTGRARASGDGGPVRADP